MSEYMISDERKALLDAMSEDAQWVESNARIQAKFRRQRNKFILIVVGYIALVITVGAILSACTTPHYLQGVCTMDDRLKGYC